MNKLESTIKITAPFHDVDQLGIVWHGHYIKYFEIARCELLKTFEYDYPDMVKSGYIWPIVDVKVKYRNPVRYDQTVNVTAVLEDYDNRLRISYRITDENQRLLTKGETTQVAVNAETEELEFFTPEFVVQNIQKAKKND